MRVLQALLSLHMVACSQARYQCPHGKPAKTSEASWLQNKNLMSQQDDRTPKTPDRHIVNLDLPPNERWSDIGKIYANRSDLIVQYFEDMLPSAAVVAIDKIAKHLVGYKGFGDFGDEMKGYAEALDLDLGYVVAANLVYQLESIGVNCSNWNNTGPTGQCGDDDVDEVVWFESDHYLRSLEDEVKTGYCTSVVAEEAGDGILHGRNLDWNLEEELREFIITVDFQRGGSTLYTGSTIVSFVGILNAMKSGDDGFSFSMDARCQGGKLWSNLLEALAFGAMTPCQHSRYVMETATNYDEAVHLFETGHLIDDGYFIVGGASPGQGAVVTRARNRDVDTWIIESSDDRGWYRLETNYDHDQPVPTADDRRTPGYANMEAIGKEALNEENLLEDVMKQWPTFNPHTDLTCIMSAKYDIYDCSIWLDAA
ncbi:hypothetical protein TrVE_jg1157 [Triparma verrucosa]|uniref:ceramidase n=1 Tax=Triparma verrucosa TaxID=1606542 RepID=A0A9W7F7E6_9STRA|nr:hypothetical protein TrVE_jg1157 [Triparma verrucosa]